MSERSMQITVVIPTWNRPEFVGKTALSVLSGSYAGVQVVVFDQSTNDETREVMRPLESRHSNLLYVHTTTPGASRAYNLAARETRGDLLAFIDDDCIAPSDWLETMSAAFRSERDAGLVYGQVLGPPDWQRDSAVLPELWLTAPERLSRRGRFRVVGMNANLGVRRALFERIGGFDELLGPGAALQGAGQDYDFHYRACAVGATALLRPEVKVEHYGMRSMAQWKTSIRSYARGDGAFYFKHVRCGDPFALRLLVQHVGRLVAREALEPIRRKYSQADYLRALFGGIRDSLRYPVDRHRRMYQVVSEPQRV
jgi:GT2 family glycosyltransferase